MNYLTLCLFLFIFSLFITSLGVPMHHLGVDVSATNTSVGSSLPITTLSHVHMQQQQAASHVSTFNIKKEPEDVVSLPGMLL